MQTNIFPITQGQLGRRPASKLSRAFIATLIVMGMLSAVLSLNVRPAYALAAWDMTVSQSSATPVATGATMNFRFDLQCAAIDEGVCRDTVITWPGSDPATFTVGSHPAVQSLSYNAIADQWELTLNSSIVAGSAIQLAIRAVAPNNTTPDGTPVEIDATLTSSNTAGATGFAAGEWDAETQLVIEKFGQFGPGNDLLLDTPVKYYLNPCDPTWVRDQPGHLHPTDVTVVDTLPAGAVFNSASAGGVYDVGSHSVTWAGVGEVVTEGCGDYSTPDYWVDVTFPSPTFNLTTSVQNDASVEGYPLGAPQTVDTLLTDTDFIVHSFVEASIGASASKYASTPFFGDSTDTTFAGENMSYLSSLYASSSNTTPYYFEIVDPVPCLTNDIDAGPAHQYESLAVDTTCTEPAFDITLIDLGLSDLNFVEWPDSNARIAWVIANQTLPLHFTTTTGVTGSVDVPLVSSTSTPIPDYRITAAELLLQAGLPAGTKLAQVGFDSREVGLRVAPGESGTSFELTLYGKAAPNTLAYPVETGDRIWNQSQTSFYEDIAAVTPALELTARDEVLIAPPQPSLEIAKRDRGSRYGDYVYLNAYITGSALQPGEQVIITDLLPLGYKVKAPWSFGYKLLDDEFDVFASTWMANRPSPTSSAVTIDETGIDALDDYDPEAFVNLEIIDNYQGTGRQLIRATYDEPPVVGWQSGFLDQQALYLRYWMTPDDLAIPATNTAQVFATDPITIAELTCNGNPTLVSDPNDLDADGETTADAFCEDARVWPGDPMALVLTAEKSVMGDNDTALESFPAIGNLIGVGGIGTFEISLGNVGAAAADNIVIYDILPHVGDTALIESLEGVPRESSWTATFEGLDFSTLPSGIQVEYSESTTPCRDELATSGASPYPAGCTNDWSTSLPTGGEAAVKALRFSTLDDTGGLLAFDPGERYDIQYNVSYPAGVLPGEVAWNSFAYAGTRVDDDTSFLPSEVPKVGLAVPLVDLDVDKIASPTTLLVGEPSTYTITVDHQGEVTAAGEYTLPASTAYNVELLDNAVAQGLQIVPGSVTIFNKTTLATGGGTFDESTGVITIDEIRANDTYEITYKAILPIDGTITNSVQIMSHPDVDDIDSTPGNDVSSEDDQDTATVTWGTAGLDFRKLVETEAGSGTFIEADATDSLTGSYGLYEPIAYRFEIENTGTVTLRYVDLTDDLTGFECDQYIGTISAGTTRTVNCVWPYGFGEGSFVNTASVVATPATGGTLTASDTAEVTVTPFFDLALIVEPTGTQTDPVADTDTQVSFDVTVRNQGQADPTGAVTVTSYIPAGFFIDQTATDAANVANTNVSVASDGTVTITSLASPVTETFTIVLTSDDPATTSTVETIQDLGVTTIIYGAEISDDSAPAATPDRDSFPDATDSDPIYQPADSHNDIGHLGAAYDEQTEDEDDHDREQLDVMSTISDIGNFVWLDDDRDGIQDLGELGIENVTVTLDPGTPLDASDDVTTLTGADGSYLFADLPAGDYTVTFTQPAGTSLSPTGAGTTNTDSNGLVTTVTLTAGVDDLSIDLGVWPSAMLGDFVWDDLDGDGVQDFGEPGIENVTVTLDPGTPLDETDDITTTTAPDGSYGFTDLIPGDYTVTFTQPAGTELSPTGAGTTATDSNGLVTTVTLVAAESNDTIDLGVYTPAVLGDFVWSDVNENGIQDIGETGVDGVTVTLDPGTPLDETDDLTTTTAPDGSYEFTDLAPGDYTVTFTQPAGTVLSPTGAGTTATDSNGLVTTVTLESGDDDDSIDLGLIELVGLGDFVWDDLDGDGVQDFGEPGIENVTVTLDPGTPLDETDDLSTTTAPDGSYSFADLDPGEYTVTFTQPAGTTLSPTGAGTSTTDTNGLATTVTLAPGVNDDSIDLGLYTPASLGDFVWSDLNGDGIQDIGEPGIENVTVTLDPGTPLDATDDVTTTTAPDGSYSFTDLAPGDYTVTFTQPAGFLVAPTATTTSDADSNGLVTTVTLESGDDDDTIDLGIYEAASLGDFVWDDLDGDGVQDLGEPGIPGVTVTLDPGTPLDATDDITTTTAPDGSYEFTDLAPGDYTVTFTQPSSTALSPTGAGTTATDSNGLTTSVTLAPGDNDDTIDLGVYTPASVGDFVWEDTNEDGIQDIGEPGIENVTVTLDPGTPLDETDDLTTTTDGSGNYSFTDLAPGDYTVTFTQPASTNLSPTGAGTTATDSNGLTTNVSLIGGDNDDSIDLGLIELVGLGDFVWDDLDGDGIQDVGEPGIGGVTVTLDPGTPLDETDDLSTTTAPDGSYSFADLDPGEYTVTFTQPAGTTLSPTGAGTSTTDTNGLVTTVTLGSGEGDNSIDLGVYTPASLGDFVWDDLDGDGIQDTGEPGIENVTVTLDPGTPLDAADDVTTTTAPDGSYSFTDLAPGDYTVTFTQPAGTNLSPTATTTSDADSNGLVTTVTLESGDNDNTIDLGIYTPASVGNFVWDDLDGDGIQDTGEPGIGGVTVTLDPGTPLDETDDITTTTAPDGSYGFTDLIPGDYTVTFTQPSSTVLSPTGAGTTATDSNGLTTTVTLESGDNDDSIDLGIYVGANISGQAWIDAPDAGVVDGTQDIGESGYTDTGGVTVTLDPGTPLDATDDLTTTTDGSGNYSFTDLAPGDYTVTFTEPTGYDVTIVDDLVDPTINNDDLTTTVTLTSGTDIDDIDLGLVALSSIAGIVYHDEDLDGSLGAEDGIGGVLITLTGTDVTGATVELTTTTLPDGTYEFGDIVPGTYTVTETQPANWNSTASTAGSEAGTPATDVVSAITVPPGTAATGYNFGEAAPASISGTVFIDANNNGADDLEVGIEDTEITLTGTNNLGETVTATTLTDSDGNYSFPDLAPGDYTVTETQPILWIDGLATSTGSEGGTFGSLQIADIIIGSGTAAIDYDFGELPPSSGISITKTASPDPAQAGDLVSYTLTWRNDGNVAITSTSVTEVVPAGSTFVASVDAWSCATGDPAGSVCTLAVADMAPGGAGTAVFTVDLANPLVVASQTSLPNTATIAGTSQDPTGAVPVTSSGSADPAIVSTELTGVIYLQTPTGDVPLSGSTVSLLDAAGDPVLNPDDGLPWVIEVDADGTYTFGGLAPDDYTIVETTPNGYGDATGHQPSVTVAVPLGGATQDFWHTTSSITGTVFVDEDRNDVLTPAEQPLAGVTVTLTGTDVNGNTVERTTSTDALGEYGFDGLVAGDYEIVESQPALWTNGPTVAGDNGGTTSGSDDTITAIALPAGTEATGYDFGEIGNPVGGTVFFDVSGVPIEGVEITLTGTDVFGNPISFTTTTSPDGTYLFDEVPPGDYTLTQTQPTAYISGSIAETNEITISVTGAPSLDNDFSEMGATIAGTVTQTLDGTGNPSPDDPGIPNVTMTLTGVDIDGNPILLTTTTDADGNYRFIDLPAGTYTVTETQPATYSNVATIPGTNGGTTSGSDDTIEAIVLAPGVVATGYDFNEASSAISGTVTIEGTNTPIEGVEVTLFDSTGTVVGTTTTDANGDYSFDDVLAGTYTVTQTQPNEYGSVTTNEIPIEHPTTGTANVDFIEVAGTIEGLVNVDESGAAIAGVTITLTGTDVNGNQIEQTTTTGPDGSYSFVDLPAGEFTITQNQPAGYADGAIEPDNVILVSLVAGTTSVANNYSETLAGSSIAGTVFVDGSNSAISGVTIRLYDDENVVIATTTTGSDGHYEFLGLQPGSYRVEQTQPSGYNNGVVNPGNNVSIQLAQSDARSEVNFSEVLQQVPPSRPLAFTGATVLPMTFGAILLMLLGTFMFIASRRRESNSTS